MLSETEVIGKAIAAFEKIHAHAEHGAGVRAIDGDELNLKDMKCVQKHDESWVCTLPHTHLPLENLSYEFVYIVKDDPHQAAYSCNLMDKMPDSKRIHSTKKSAKLRKK
jgi:hypothetical protein